MKTQYLTASRVDGFIATHDAAIRQTNCQWFCGITVRAATVNLQNTPKNNCNRRILR